MINMAEIKRFFYGWKIVGASIIILAVGLGMFTSTNSVFVKPVCDTLGFTRSQFTLHRTIITLASLCVMPFYSKIIQRIGTKKTLVIGATALSGVTIAYSFANSLWHFYAMAFVNGIFFNTLSFMVIGILVSYWFEDKRGLATGLAYAGSGLGGAVMIPIVSRVIELTDWRFAYLCMSVFGLVILIPVILIFIKETPEKSGLKPYTSQKANQAEQQKNEQPALSLSLRESLLTSRFWLLAVAFLLISVFAGATNTHSAPYMSDIGYSTAMVSAVISLFMLFMTVGKILLGMIYDRFGSMAGNILIAVCSLIFPIAALLSHISAFTWVYAVTLGMASCGVSVPVPILITKYFGMKDYPAIFGIFVMIATLGPSLSVPVMGAVYDYLGSYRPAWIALLAFSMIIAVCLTAAEITYRKKSKNINIK
jgi:MFS family permease